ncbi:hypothetical protein [Glaciibacter superstes]|uniref:hypothetical protein n=1 Tax=Glaciibacter superstes TaxID=501023 RepID=UPI0003B52F43|nr:hypothetical protein [Glaciibacter superstes]
MNRSILRAASGIALAAAALLSISACSSDSSGSSSSAEALPPVIVEIDSLDGTTVEVPMGGAIDITGDDETFTDWSADISDPAIAEFTPGKDDGSAQFNPGITPLKEGTTDVTMSNSTTDDTVDFTVTVTPKK